MSCLSADQRKICDRCKKMLKTGFPRLKGKIIFSLTPKESVPRMVYVEQDSGNENMELIDEEVVTLN